jgi:hypothetical protein
VSELYTLPTFQSELYSDSHRHLSLEQFQRQGYYYRSSQPHYAYHLSQNVQEKLRTYSLENVLQFEVSEFIFKRKAKAVATGIYKHILEEKLPKWVVAIGVTELPASSEVTLELLDKIISEYNTTWKGDGMVLGTADFDDEFNPFDMFVHKLSLCCSGGDRIYQQDSYDPSSFIYCGFCSKYISARNPMSLGQAGSHFSIFHRKVAWKEKMLIQIPRE